MTQRKIDMTCQVSLGTLNSILKTYNETRTIEPKRGKKFGH